MVLSAILRFYKIGDMPFDTDELSAVFRAQKSHSFLDNIKIGVLPDGHPFFVQTLIWLLTIQLQLPLITLKILWVIISLGSIALSYSILNRVFNKATANFTIAFLSVLWWSVDIATWVRPYIIGQFGVLLAIDGISRIRLKASKWAFIQAILGTLIGLSSHYFAGLTILIYSITFVFFYKDSWIWMAKILGLTLLLYLPQWPIFIAHLNLKGLNWLSVPTYHFLWNHIFYLFNQQLAIIALVGISVGFGGWLLHSQKIKPAKHMWVFGATWLGVLLVGFIYSVFRKPVLQDNVMFFSLPLFLGFGGYLFSQIPQKIHSSFFALIAFLGIFNLIFQKKHYDLAMKDKFQYPMLEISKKSASKSADKWTFLVDGPSETLNFYRAQLNIPQKTNLIFLNNYQTNMLHLTDSIIKKLKTSDTLFYAMNSGTDLTQLAALKFGLTCIPSNGRKEDHFIGGSIYYFIKKDTLDSPKIIPTKTLSVSLDSNYLFRWSEIADKNKEIKEHKSIEKNDFLVVTFTPTNPQLSYHLVSSILNQGFNKALSLIDYRYSESTRFKGSTENTVIHCIKLSDIPFWNAESFLCINIKTEQKNKSAIQKGLSNGKLRIYHFKGNPYLYGI
jgi:hypothetical protein